MRNEIDCRGMNCPAPVLQVRNLLQEDGLSSLTVFLDNEAARQNVTRFLEHQNYEVTSERHGDEFRVVGIKVNGTDSPAVTPSLPVENKRSGERNKKIMVLISGIHMGRGDDALGDMLMFNFLKTLKEMGPDLWRVTMVNSGVSFVAEDSEAVPLLLELAEMGVQITACGACLAFFHILDKMKVGEVTNMLDIVTGMKEADSVITV